MQRKFLSPHTDQRDVSEDGVRKDFSHWLTHQDDLSQDNHECVQHHPLLHLGTTNKVRDSNEGEGEAQKSGVVCWIGDLMRSLSNRV
jgi:hypothetical protein